MSAPEHPHGDAAAAESSLAGRSGVPSARPRPDAHPAPHADPGHHDGGRADLGRHDGGHHDGGRADLGHHDHGHHDGGHHDPGYHDHGHDGGYDGPVHDHGPVGGVDHDGATPDGRAHGPGAAGAADAGHHGRTTGRAGHDDRRGGHHHGDHSHRPGPDADARWLVGALLLIVVYMGAEVVVGLAVGSLALLSDAAHMLTDAGAIGLALVAMRLAAGRPRTGYTYGLRRAEILSAQANGITLLLLAGWFAYEAVRRLVEPRPVAGLPVLITALAGVVVNLAAAALVRRADRRSLNVEGAYQHIVTDLAAFAATAVAAVLILTTGWHQADTLASVVVVVLMTRAGFTLVRDSGRILLEAAPAGLDPGRIAQDMTGEVGVVDVHDLHVWEITSGSPALSAHVIVAPALDCHRVRVALERLLRERYDLTHTTLQVDHAPPVVHRITLR